VLHARGTIIETISSIDSNESLVEIFAKVCLNFIILPFIVSALQKKIRGGIPFGQEHEVKKRWVKK
jgi:hypothetical protein